MTAETVTVRQMNENDLNGADDIMQRAFGTFLGLPSNIRFMGDADYIKTRYRADPSAALVAETDSGKIVGSNFAMDWGSIGVFGPLTIDPDYWNKGIARRLLQETMKIFQRWGSKHLGLFTFAQSGKHIYLYQKFNFWPRYLTAIMSKEIEKDKSVDELGGGRFADCRLYSQLSELDRVKSIMQCRELTNCIYQGLELKKEIDSVYRQRLGDTILMHDSNSKALVGFAVCHVGAGSEAGSGNCYIKFGAVRPGEDSAQVFSQFLDAAMYYAHLQQLSKIVAGVNMARHSAYKILIEQGFKTEIQGVAMENPNEPGYNLQNNYVIDDWR